MDKIRQIKSIDDLKEFLLSNKEFLKKAALPVTVVVALLFFWAFGGSGDEEIREEDKALQEVTEEETIAAGESSHETTSDIYVDISGCVKAPGVYKVSEGTRLFELIEKAGGLTENADIGNVNRAEEVYDGQKVVIYSTEEEKDGYISQSEADTGKVNINRADSSALQTIPGVGPATAQKIIEYRESNGRFSSIEEIKNISGIGEKTFENMKEYITV